MRAKEFIPAEKPRNFVAKNAKMGGAGQHKDKKRDEKQGNVKHKRDLMPMEAKGKWDPFSGGDFGQSPHPGQNDGDASPDKQKEKDKWEAMLDYYGTNALVARALGDLYQQTHGSGYYDNISGPIKYVATIVSGLGNQRTEVINVKNKQEAHEKARGKINGRVISIEKVDTKEDEEDLITLPVMLGLGAQRKKWMLKFPDERYAQKWEFKHKNVAKILWGSEHELSKPEEKVGEQRVAEGSAHGYNVVRWYRKNRNSSKITAWLKKEAGLPKETKLYFDDADLVLGSDTLVPEALVDDTLKFNDLLTALVQATGGTAKQKVDGVYRDQGMAEGAEQMTPNWAKYVLDQIYNSNGAVTLTDLFDEGIPGLHDMFMDTAKQHGLDPEEDFEDVQHELTVELENLINGRDDLEEGEPMRSPRPEFIDTIMDKYKDSLPGQQKPSKSAVKDYTPKVGDEVLWRHSDPMSKMMPMPGTVLAVAPGKVKLKIYSKRMIQDRGTDTVVLGLDNYKITPKKDVAEGLNELSSDLLGRYKKAAGNQATAADKAGDYDKGHKRFKGIVKATNKQFDNDAKKRK